MNRRFMNSGSFFHPNSSSEVVTTLTTDVGKVMAKLQQVQPKGEVNFVTGVRIAHVGFYAIPFLSFYLVLRS